MPMPIAADAMRLRAATPILALNFYYIYDQQQAAANAALLTGSSYGLSSMYYIIPVKNLVSN
jgi:hypothetical protein